MASLIGFAEALSRLTVNRDVMAQNLASAGASVCAENLMMTLAPLVGRGRAHDIVHHALETGGPDALFTDVNITNHLSESQIKTALRPLALFGDSVRNCSPGGHARRRHSNPAASTNKLV